LVVIRQCNHKNNYLANRLWTLRRVSCSWHFSISTISRLWEKHHQTCKM